MHLFAGAGGGLLADLILGHTPVVAVEWDAYCCQVLRERADEGWFPGLRVYEGDVRLFDPSEYEGRVDCISAGFPCVDISTAGKGAGIAEGTRSGLWSEVVRVARVVRPHHLFIENVAAIVTNGLDRLLADIASLGMDARWDCLRASDCGAPHGRDRWWLVAYPRGESASGGDGPGLTERSATITPSWPMEIGDTSRRAARSWSPDVADAECERGRCRKANGEDAGDAGESSRHSFVGWWDAESEVGRVVDGMADRSRILKALGNGQVPLQAALAWKILTA